MYQFKISIILFFSLFLSLNLAISEKKNPPKNDDVIEEALKLAGDLHYPDEFKFDDIGTIDHEDTYYHAFIGYNDDGTYKSIMIKTILDIIMLIMSQLIMKIVQFY